MQHVARHVVIADADGWSASHHAGSRSDSCKDLKRIASMQSTGQAATSLTTNPFALLEDSGSDDTKVDAERDIEDPTLTTMHTVMDELHHSPTSWGIHVPELQDLWRAYTVATLHVTEDSALVL
jgi:hypothetical protein